MHIVEREVNGRRYRIAAQSVWDAERGRFVARQVVLGSAEPPRVADLSATQTVGTRGVGDVGALIWIAEQLDRVGQIDRACAGVGAKEGPPVGELAVAVAIQRACAPGPKCELGEFLDASLPRLSCLPGSAFTGQAFHRLAQQVSDEQLEQAQVAIAKAAVARFELSADVLAFDTTNFDTPIDTQTPGELARRGHAKSKRSDLRVVGLGVLVSETGHVPLLYRTYPGNGSDQAVLAACLGGLARLHEALDSGEGRERPAQRTVVRDGGFWSPQRELDLDAAGHHSLISLPLGHKAAEEALQMAAQRGAMKPLPGKLSDVRAARVRTTAGGLGRTLVVVASQALLAGQKRGIAVALRKAKVELSTLEGLIEKGRITREIVGWAMGARMTQQLVIDALRMAWFRKHPGKQSSLVFHSDRGSPYASLAFRNALKGYGMVQSMSGKGNCFDNAPRGWPRAMESFWHSLKVEEVHGCNYASREEATRAIVTYIEAFYNCERRRSSIDYLSPRQYERQFYQKQGMNQNNSVKQSTKP